MDRQPTLAGETLLLRPLVESDREALFAVASDREIWALHPAHDRWQRSVFDTLFDDALANGGALAVVDRESGRIVGSSQYRPSAAEPGAMEIGWTFLERARWGGAANRELKRLMLGHALGHVERCVFRVGAENHRSRGAMVKIGARLLERVDMVDYPDGRRIPHVFYKITRDAFASGPLNSPEAGVGRCSGDANGC